MKKINIISALLQGVVLIGTVGGFYIYTQKEVNPQEVYVYNRSLSANTIIQDSDLLKKYVPGDAITEDMIRDKGEAVGKCVITKTFQNEYVNKQALVDPDSIDPFSQIDLSKYRKISLPIDSKDAVGGNVHKGDKVDLAYINEADNGNGSFVYAKTFMSDVLVYNVIDDGGKQYIDQTEGASNVTDADGNTVTSGNVSIITFAVTPEQAEEIQARAKTGSIKLIGRFEESVTTETPGYTIGKSGTVQVAEADPEN